MSIGILGTIIILAVIGVVALIKTSISTKQLNNECEDRARKIEKLKPDTYTDKQLKRIEAIESIYDENLGWGGAYDSGKITIADKEILSFIQLYKREWIAIYEDEVLPSKACSENLHIYPVSRRDFSKYYNIYIRNEQEQHSEGKMETVAPNASVTKRAVAGAIIGGGVGAVVGAASAIDKNSRGPQSRYVSRDWTEKRYFTTIQSYFFDKDGKVQAPSRTIYGFNTYMKDDEIIKQLTPNTGKEEERNIKLADNYWDKTCFWYIHQQNWNNATQASEVEKALEYLLNEY